MNTIAMLAHIGLAFHPGRALPFFVLAVLILFVTLVVATAAKDKTK